MSECGSGCRLRGPHAQHQAKYRISMVQHSSDRTEPESVDIAICGGGMAGLLLARQIRSELPELSVCVLERTRRPLPAGCHKVGEATVELGSQYFERLGLRKYLLENHIEKLGLRLFPGGGHLPLAQRTEIGPCSEPVVSSYQVDRGRFENDMRAFIEEDGACLIEGAKVGEVDFGEGADEHTVHYELDEASRSLRARWVLDATGRVALLRKKLRMTRGARHDAHAGWFRIPGPFDINDMVPASETDWHQRPCSTKRWRSTNHFMGTGYWVWVIPLSSGHSSIGLVVHDETHDHACISSLEAVQAFLEEHEPHLYACIKDKEVKDFLCLRRYSYTVGRAWSDQRWAMVGEAGAFVDPLYSPGADFIAIANSFTVELLKTERSGGDVGAKANQLNGHYRALVTGMLDIFNRSGPVFGHPRAMATKIFWDNFSYWSFTCHFFQQDLHQLTNEEYGPYGDVGRRFLSLGHHVQAFLRAWAERAPEDQEPLFIGAPHFPSIQIDAHIRVAENMKLEKLLEYYKARAGHIEEMAAEIVLRVVQELGPDVAREVLAETDFASWGITITPFRLETEGLTGHARRTRLTTIARDIERTIGKVRYHEQAAEARALLAQPATKKPQPV